MKPAQNLLTKLRDGKTALGMLVTNHLWPEVLDIAIAADLDYFVIDLEHGPHDESMVAAVCASARLVGYPVLIRPVANDFRTASKMMDLGPCGLVLAAVEDTETLDGVRDAVRMPPRGKRRPGGLGNYWVENYHYETWKHGVEDHAIVIPQIETRRGLENVRAIAEHPIVTAVGIGPYDLGMAVGTGLNQTDPAFVSARQQVEDAARAVGKPFWNVGYAPRLAQQGYRFLCFGDPMVALARALRDQTDQTRQAATKPNDPRR